MRPTAEHHEAGPARWLPVYWSSSQQNADFAFEMVMGFGARYPERKAAVLSVRPIRAF